MSRKTATKLKTAAPAGARVLTVSDARSFSKFAKSYTASASRTKASARKFLIESGMLTPTGRLTSRYKSPKA
jgi:hypothetical protein